MAAGYGAPPQSAFAFQWPGYQVRAELGRGGFGVVYAAVREIDGLAVAVKVRAPGQAEADGLLSHEAAALAVVGPPHVPAVLGQGCVDGVSYLALELIRAPTLAELLVQAAGPMALERFHALASALLLPVEGIHAKGYVHLDLKPENILLPELGQARVVDFGLARRSPSSRAMLAAHTTGALGTAEYMSPEQCDGEPALDARSDVYSLGVLLYEMLSGVPPFWGEAPEVREAQRSRRPVSLMAKVGCGDALSRVIGRCLAKRPSERFQDVASLRRALARVAGSPRSSEPPSPSPAVRETLRPSAPDASGRPSLGPRQQRTVGLVFFESPAGLGDVQAVVMGAGGHLAQASGKHYVAAFDHDTADNPARQALMAAQRLVAGKLAVRCLVDVAVVSMRRRGDGARRRVSSVFAQGDRFPVGSEPHCIVVTVRAAEAMPGLTFSPVDGVPDRVAWGGSRPSQAPAALHVQTLPWVGRDEILSRLAASSERALLRGEPTLFSVVADAGYGKTHLASVASHHLLRVLGQVELISLSAQENVEGSSAQLLPELLRRVLDLPDDAPSAGGQELLLERFGSGVFVQAWVGVAFALGWIDSSHVEVKALVAAPAALRFAVARGAGEALRLRARRGPLALVVDDGHLADEATLDALEYATMQESGARIWVCVLVRPSFTAARPNWATRAAHAESLTLGPLSANDAIELTRHLLLPAEHVPPQALSRLAERAEGVPRLLVDLVRGLKREGLIRHSERGTGYYLATDELNRLPDVPVLQWNTSREIEALPAGLAAHARLCTVFGGNFSHGELEALLQILERDGLSHELQLDALVGLQRLVQAGTLSRRDNGTFDFRHALLRDTIYRLMPESERALLHRAAYEVYQTLAMPREQRLRRVAVHAARSGQREAAVTAYLVLAERMLQAQAYLEAEAAYGGALANLTVPDGARVIEAARGRGRVRFRLGRHEDGLKDLGRAREVSRVLGNIDMQVELMLDEATVLDWTQDMPQSIALVRAAASLKPDCQGLLAVRLAVGQARVKYRLGEHGACVELGARAAAQALDYGEAGYEARVIALSMVAFCCALLGRLDEAGKHFDALIGEARAHSDLLHLAVAYTNRALLWVARCDTARFVEDLDQTIRTAREAGTPLMEHGARWAQAECEYVMGELRASREHSGRAIELATHLWGPSSLALASRELLVARIALYEGSLAEAESLATSIRARIMWHESGEGKGDRFPSSDAVLLEMVELGAGDASAEQWDDLERRAGGANLQAHEQVEITEIRGLATHRVGRFAESRLAFARALALTDATPNLLGERVKRMFHQLFGPGVG